ncbi:hypothetical protein ANCCAN_05266 [Ancylostoma caninum]|uniref:Peptidase M12A domain-containing protein n=1 Tax=Ancylostoma caninum TaxID=29170 RepID=A0A368H023_ANCCA|nr:hypothetical protein ANCCAN_05266 [Ancylostoma caninum]
MHYRSKAFSRYDDLYTISTFVTDYQKTIGQRDQLSFNDIRLMNKIYCSNVCSRKLPCQRGGYTDPRRLVNEAKKLILYSGAAFFQFTPLGLH